MNMSLHNELLKCILENDIEVFYEKKSLTMMRTLKDMIECCSNEDLSSFTIPLSNISKDTMDKIVEYCYHYIDDNSENKYYELYNIDEPIAEISEWDINFFKSLNINKMTDILNNANYLNIPGLLEKGSRYIAEHYISNKTIEELRELFNTVDDFTPEEKEKIKNENEWCEIK